MNRSSWAEIDLGIMKDNFVKIKEILPPSTKLMAVVKADGYGHGSYETARLAERAGANYLAVAYWNEALVLREQGIQLPILILTPIDPEYIELALLHDLILTVTSASWFEEMRLHKAPLHNGKIKVHVKMDTGLGRLGVKTKDMWEQLVPHLLEDDVEVDGFYTHFATASREDSRFLEEQLHLFMDMIEWSKSAGVRVTHYHCAGSAAALRFPHLAMDMVRIGAALYGFYPEKLANSVKLEPVLSLYSRLIQVKKLNRGDYLGYDNSYRADEDEWIGTVSIGYADGWSQRLQQAELLVGGKRAAIVGKICMDQLMVRLPYPYKEGTRVVLIGKQGDEQMTCAELADKLGTVPQEITTSLTARVSRLYG